MKLAINSKQTLRGQVTVSGAKNSATRILAASLLTERPVKLRNFPLLLEDVKAKMAFISDLGVQLTANNDLEELGIEAKELSFSKITNFNLPIRTTYLLAGGALARNGHAKVPYPGGCKIGSRGYDLHIMVWRNLGCKVIEHEEYIEIKGKLTGGEINFPISTVGGTENALICSCIANGESVIKNAYVTPEVYDLIEFLRDMGARIELQGTSHIRVQGRSGLLDGSSFSIMPDRIEALTWAILGAVSENDIHVVNVPFHTMDVPLIHLRDTGIDFFSNSNSIHTSPQCIGPHGIQPFELATGTHPGVISDMQPFFVFLALFANGRSVIHDYRYPERIGYVSELEKFAPKSLYAQPGKIVVEGPIKLKGANAESTDLRGSMTQIMAALCADGASTVNGVEMALRGYNNLEGKLASLGVDATWQK